MTSFEFRRYAADTSAMIAFSTAVGLFVELGLSGLSPAQSLHARLAAVPVMLATGRPYGIYRDWLRCMARVPQSNPAVLDMVANATFQVPLYAVILAFSGARTMHIIMAAASVLVISTVSGRPYGLFLDWCRKLAGAAPR